jgi:hypothetical protein
MNIVDYIYRPTNLPLHQLRKDPHKYGSNFFINKQLISALVAITIVIGKCIIGFG